MNQSHLNVGLLQNSLATMHYLIYSKVDPGVGNDSYKVWNIAFVERLDALLL